MVYIITLFKLPEFLKDSKKGKNLLEYSNDLKIGSEEWINEMNNEIEVENFAETDDVNNIFDFFNIIKVCDNWNCNFPISIFIYYLLNEKKCYLELHIKYLELYNIKIEDLNYIAEDILNINIKKSKKDDINRIKYIIKDNIDNKNNYSNEKLAEFIFEYDCVHMVNDSNIILSNDKRSFLEICLKLNEFNNMYKYRKDDIYNIPLIPYKNKEILNKSYYNYCNFILNSYYIDNFKNVINEFDINIEIFIFINSIRVGRFIIGNLYYLMLIIKCLETQEDFSFKIYENENENLYILNENENYMEIGILEFNYTNLNIMIKDLKIILLTIKNKINKDFPNIILYDIQKISHRNGLVFV